MGRTPCCDKSKVKRGPWSPEEDETLKNYLEKHGTGGNWISLPQKAGLRRCGKSCRLRWLNYLRPDIKHGAFTEVEDEIICTLYSKMGSRWSIIASQLPGRTDNDVKNYWNTKLKKKLIAATNNTNNGTAVNKPLFDSSTNLLSSVSQTKGHNPTFSASLTSLKLPLLTDHHDLTGGFMFNTKNIAYDPMCFSLLSEGSTLSTNANTLCNLSPISQEGSTISGSSSLAMEDNYTIPCLAGNGGLNGGFELEGIRFDISNGYPYDLMGGIWPQEAAVEALPCTSYASLDSAYYVDTEPHGMCPNVTTTDL